MRICTFYEFDFPNAFPILDLSLSPNRFVPCVKPFKPNQNFAIVLIRERTFDHMLAVLPSAFVYVLRMPCIENAAWSIGDDISAKQNQAPFPRT